MEWFVEPEDNQMNTAPPAPRTLGRGGILAYRAIKLRLYRCRLSATIQESREGDMIIKVIPYFD